jgi:hypothetical protein
MTCSWIGQSPITSSTGSVADGRYIYHNFSESKQASATETLGTCPSAESEPSRDVHQYGVDYIQITCQGDFTLTFTGSTATGLLPMNAYSGDYAFWTI